MRNWRAENALHTYPLSKYVSGTVRRVAHAKGNKGERAASTRNVIPVDLGQAERVDEMGWKGQRAMRALSYSRKR